MKRALVVAGCLACSAALAEGPGSQLRTSEFPRVPDRAELERVKLCQALKAPEERRRCLRELRPTDEAPGKLSGPESTGTPSGAGAGASAGAGAPR